MSMITNAPCSPYLLRPQRSLRRACGDMAHELGWVGYRCGVCALRDMCQRQPAVIGLPAKRTDVVGLPAVIIGDRKAAA